MAHPSVTFAPSCAARPSPRWAGVLATLALVLAWAGVAFGQIRDMEPSYVTVTDERAVLRSGDLRSYYPIADLDAGDVLRATGQSQRWLRVEYPTGLEVLVRADGATLDEDAGVVTLSRGGRLKALSDTRYGVDGSFRDVQGVTPPPGSELRWLRTTQSKRGVVFYVVRAPAGAAGFVERDQVRPATPEEVRAARARAQGQPQQDDAQPPAQPQGGGQEADGPSSGDRLMDPMAPPPSDDAGTGTDAGDDRPERQQPAPSRVDQPLSIEDGAQDDSRPADGPAGRPDDRPGERPDDRQPAPAGRDGGGARDSGRLSLEELSAAFDAVRAQGTLDAEVDELIATFERALEATPQDADNAARRDWLGQRLALLEVRRKPRENLRAVERARARLEQRGERSERAMEAVRASAIYDYVGKLRPSAVYDGRRLPRMYRLVTVGEGVPRTLGYIEPREELGLERKLGVLVGVMGEASRRSELRLNAIQAQRVDVLRGPDRTPTEPPGDGAGGADADG